jgi:hypothetical protein
LIAHLEEVGDEEEHDVRFIDFVGWMGGKEGKYGLISVVLCCLSIDSQKEIKY